MQKSAHDEIYEELARLEAILDRNAKAGQMTLLEHNKLTDAVALGLGRLEQMKIWER